MISISPRIRLLLAGCAFGACLSAQGVTINATAATSIDAWTWAYVGGQLNYNHPAGPMAASGVVGQPLGWFSMASVTWETESTSAAERFTLQTFVQGQGSLGSAAIQAFSIVLDVSSPTTRAVELDLERVFSTWGLPLPPTVAIDIGNDGTVEYADLPAALTTVQGLTVGPTPLQIAISVSGTTYGGSGGSTTVMAFTIRPDNDLAIHKEVDTCLPGVAGLEPPVPVFADDGVDLHFSPGLLVASTQSTPTVWGPNSPLPFATSCLLVPQPDILIWLPSGYSHIALPPAVRPVQFHVQVVFISPAGIVASDGYEITAN